MKALLIKSLPCTNTLPARFKSTIEGQKPCTISQESHSLDNNSPDCLQLQAAKIALHWWGLSAWLDDNVLSVGQLPNRDHVVTLSAKSKLFKCESESSKGVTVTEYYLGNRLAVTNKAQKTAIQCGHHTPLVTPVNYYVGNDNFFDIQGVKL